MTRVVAVCSSKKRGPKKEVDSALLREDWGIVGDVHSGSARQVSLLTRGSITKMRRKGFSLPSGCFGENLVIEGLSFKRLRIGTRIKVGSEVVLEVTEIGKACANPCAIFRRFGTCVMPKEGVFVTVVKGGMVRKNDAVSLIR